MSGSGSGIGQLLATIQAALDSTGVYVAPALQGQVDAGEVARIEAAVSRSPEPVFVVVHPFTYDDVFGGNPGDLLSRLHDASGRDGLYLANDTSPVGSEVRLEARAWESGTTSAADPYQVTEVGSESGPTDVGVQLVTVTEAVADGTLAEQYDALPSVVASRSGSGLGSADDGSVAPYVVGGGVVIALVLAVVLSRRKRRPTAGPQPSQTGTEVPRFVLPDSVLERARAAHDQQLQRQAHREVLALGEAIDAAEMSTTDPPEAWQAALDHYEAARRILGDAGVLGGREPDADPVDVLDVVGALVLVDRGRQALESAEAGRAFAPEPTCFLDPLHERGTSRGRLEVAGTEVRVPLCRACRTALKAGRRPEILDVIRDGRAVHYFETGAEPWASTGYGTVSGDLVELLHRR